MQLEQEQNEPTKPPIAPMACPGGTSSRFRRVWLVRLVCCCILGTGHVLVPLPVGGMSRVESPGFPARWPISAEGKNTINRIKTDTQHRLDPNGAGDWKVARTGRLESLPYVAQTLLTTSTASAWWVSQEPLSHRQWPCNSRLSFPHRQRSRSARACAIPSWC